MRDIPGDLAELIGPPPSVGAVVDVPSPTASAVAVGDVAYEGASQFDQLALWAPSIRSADAEIATEKPRLDARVRDMLRNDSFVAGIGTLHKDNIVGAMYLLNAKPMTKMLFGSDDTTWEEEAQEELETKFTLYAESPECWIDAQRTKTLTDIIRLGVGVDLAGGEVLASSEWMPNDGRPYRTALQMIDTDRLSNPWTRYMDNRLRRGVEIDKRGAPIAYHIRMGHPGDFLNAESYTWRRVMARKTWGRAMILHLFEELRPDQHRGLSTMVTALSEMKMLKGFRKVELQRAVLAATYAASIESELPNAEVFRALGGDDPNANPAIEWMAQYLSAIQEYSGGSKNLTIDGVKIPVMMPGTKLNLTNPGADSPSGSAFEESGLRYVAASGNVSYEQLSRDYSKVNYSAGRMSRGETEKGMASRKRRTADRIASFAYRNWLEEAINRGDLECMKRRRAPNFYEGLNAEAYSNCEWIGAGMGLIDPLKETQAFVLQLKNGLTTKENVIARLQGGDWRQTIRQIAREMRADEKAQTPSVYKMAMTDAENALSGTPQTREPKENEADGE